MKIEMRSKSEIDDDRHEVPLLSSSNAIELVGNAHKYQSIVMVISFTQCVVFGVLFFGLNLFLQLP